MNDTYIKNIIFCNNCGKNGHSFHQCKLPITSIGIISIRKYANKTELLLIRRKNSLGFVDFMRGKYNINNMTYITNLLNKMSTDERNLIINNNFDYLWNYLWGKNINNQYKSEERSSNDKLNKLKEGVIVNGKLYTIKSLINDLTETYHEPEWGFPKGRRNFQEKDITCAIREFEEETGYSRTNIKIIYNIFPLEEIYTGSNYKSYKHKYFLSFMDGYIIPNRHFQETEISKIEWVDINKCASYIREYNVEKIQIIEKLQSILKNNTVYT
jgi:8-oxo-dGTP pyrophosphatase MutT (NUDIX family)